LRRSLVFGRTVDRVLSRFGLVGNVRGEQFSCGSLCRLGFPGQAGNEKGGDKIAAVFLSHFFSEPVADLQVLPYLAPFMAVLQGFFGMMLGFPEWMLRIANRFAHDF
jgi:hypothetical protein